MRTKPLNPNSMEVVMENFRHFRKEIKKHAGEHDNKVYLFESDSRRPSKYIELETLIKNRRQGLISERQMIRMWERSAVFQIEQVLTEGMMDDLRAGYESAKSGVLKIVDKMSTTVAAAWKKVNDVMISLSMQAYQLATRSVSAVQGVVHKLMDWNAKFKENHPILHKILSIIIFMVIIYAIMALFGAEAHAGVTLPGGGEMNDTQYEALRGLLSAWQDHTLAGGQGDWSQALDIGNAIKVLDNAYQTENLELLTQLGEHTGIAFTKLQEVVSQAQAGDEAAFDLFKAWLDVGQNMVIH